MKDEIASFKVTAADIQKQSVHPSGDRHTQRDVAILYFYIHYVQIQDWLQYVQKNIRSVYLFHNYSSVCFMCVPVYVKVVYSAYETIQRMMH